MNLLLLCLFACEENSTKTGSSDTGETGENMVNDGNCPDEVPSDYWYTWDCLNVDCGGSTVYRAGSGATIANGNISMSEQWFVFDGVQPCIDTFEITGVESSINLNELGFPNYERVFEITWALTDMQCNINWSNTFGEQESEEQIYEGLLMLDTHTRVSFDESVPLERFDENAFTISVAPRYVEGGYIPVPDYATGTATPTGEDGIGVPESYVYASAGTCYQ